jgi:hypothetical protein
MIQWKSSKSLWLVMEIILLKGCNFMLEHHFPIPLWNNRINVWPNSSLLRMNAVEIQQTLIFLSFSWGFCNGCGFVIEGDGVFLYAATLMQPHWSIHKLNCFGSPNIFPEHNLHTQSTAYSAHFMKFRSVFTAKETFFNFPVMELHIIECKGLSALKAAIRIAINIAISWGNICKAKQGGNLWDKILFEGNGKFPENWMNYCYNLVGCF